MGCSHCDHYQSNGTELAAPRPSSHARAVFVPPGFLAGRPWGDFGSRGRGHLATHFWEKNEAAKVVKGAGPIQ